MFSVYRTLSLRYLQQRWSRAVLIVASIALGVATLVATTALNHTMSLAVQAAANPLAGVADLHVGPAKDALNQSMLRELSRIEGVRSVRPLVLENIRLVDFPDRSVLLIGADWQPDNNDNPWGIEVDGSMTDAVRSYLQGQTPVLVGKELNQKLNGSSATFNLRVPGKKEPTPVTRVGTVDAKGVAAALGGNVLVTAMNTAGQVLGKAKGFVSRFDLFLQPGADRDKVRQQIETTLQGRGLVRTPESDSNKVRDVMAGLQLGFALCGAGALVVGLFLVYNSLSVSVAERRFEIGVLRSLGATRGQIWALFLGEAGVLGLAGVLLGIPCGVALGNLGLGPMQQVLSDLILNVEARRVVFSPEAILTAAAAGIITALLAALIPAVRAATEDPAHAVRMNPSAHEFRHQLLTLCTCGLFLSGGAACMVLRNSLPIRVGTYGGMVLVLLGLLMLTPFLAGILARLLLPIIRSVSGIEGRLAADNMIRSPGRTGLVITALAAGVAMIIQTAGVITSNEGAIINWVNDSIVADLFVTSGSPVSGSGQNQEMDEGVRKEIESLPEVEAALPMRFRQLDFRDTLIFLAAVDAKGFYDADQKKGEVPGRHLFPRLLEPGMPRAIISDNFAALHGVKEGDQITLHGREASITLLVVGAMADYSWNRGTVLMDRNRFREVFHDDAVDVFDVYLRPEADHLKIREEILHRWGAEHALVVLTREELRGRIRGIIRRLYGLAYSQEIVVGIVAALGVVMALLISVLQRRRELGLLRAVGATQAQVLRSVLAEATLMGFLGTIIGLLIGIPLEWYCVRVILFEEAGFLFPFLIPWLETAVIAVLALTVATLAGLGPALRALRLRIPEAIAYE